MSAGRALGLYRVRRDDSMSVRDWGGAAVPYSGPALDRPIMLWDLLEAGLARGLEADALICAEFTWSWRTLDRVTQRLAQSYLELGLRPGDRIASLMPNRPRLIAHYIACFRAGLVATPLNYRYTATEIDHALDVSGARALLVHAEREPDLDESRAAQHLALGRIGYPRPSRDGVSFDDLIDGEPTAPPSPRPDPSDPARHLLHLRQHRPSQGCHAHPSDGGLDACDRGSGPGAERRRSAARRLVLVARGRVLRFVRRAQRRRRIFSSPAASTAMSCCRCCGRAGRPCCRCSLRPCSPSPATTALAARTSPRCGYAAPPATASRPSSSASSPG